MEQRVLPSAAEDKTVADCLRDLEGVLSALRRVLYKPVFEQGQALDPRLRSFAVANAALLHALLVGDDRYLHKAGNSAKEYTAATRRYLVDPATEDDRAHHRLLELPRELLETRASTMDMVKDLVAGALRKRSSLEVNEQQTLQDIAAWLVEVLIDDPIVIAPFLEPAPQRRRGTEPKLVASDYFAVNRRADAVAAACNALDSALPTDSELDTARSAIKAALQALGFEGEPFSYEKHRDNK